MLAAIGLWVGLAGCRTHSPPTDADRVADPVPTTTTTRGDAAAGNSVASGTTDPNGGLPAFPGAEGFGANATGGRGGRVVYVTNLNAEGEGSFQWAVEQPGARYVLFKVSGVIAGSIHVPHGDITIAGQPSPGGIIVRGLVTDETPFVDSTIAANRGVAPTQVVGNFIIRHIRSRPALNLPTRSGFLHEDGLRIRRSHNGIVDHLSIGNAYDESIEVSMSHDITVQNCLLAENTGENAPYGGFLIQFTDPAGGFELNRLSIHHNCWNRIVTRCPAIGGLYARQPMRMQIEVSNNLYWDTAFYMEPNPVAYEGGPPIYYQLNWVGNYGYQRASAPGLGGGYTYGAIDSQFLVLAPQENATYFKDNRVNLYADVSDYQLSYCCNDYPQVLAGGIENLTFPRNENPGPFARSARLPFPPITYHPSAHMRDYMTANVGAFPRDPMDSRLMAPVRTGTIDPADRNINPAGDTFTLAFASDAPPQPPADSDSDGMPDEWERAHGLKPDEPDHNGRDLSISLTGRAGYTNLECYLNELADRIVRR